MSERDLESADRREMSDLIRNCREGRLPLVVPLTLPYHHCRRLKDDWVD